MAKIRTGFYLRCVTPPRDYEETSITRYRIRGKGSTKIRKVSVDRDGLWTCSCRSNRYRGMCYHVNLIQFELERVNILKKLRELRCDPAVVPRNEFLQYFPQERFVAEPIYRGKRYYLLVARYVWLGAERKREWEFKDFHRYAGTVVEGVWDNVPSDPSRRFRVFDCLYFKGLCLKQSPLGFRRDLAEKLVAAMARSEVGLTDYEYEVAGKENLLMVHGAVMLKDVASPYDRQGKSPRCWMVSGRG